VGVHLQVVGMDQTECVCVGVWGGELFSVFVFAFLFVHYIFLRLFCIIEDNVAKSTNKNS